MFGLFKKKLPHCDALFKKYSSPWYDLEDRPIDSHIFTTGTWTIKGNKISLHSKYQEDEYRVFENYRPEYGDSLVKIYVQTYDSLVGFFQNWDYQYFKNFEIKIVGNKAILRNDKVENITLIKM